jgi:drug/metabolite transporter (DMT)-like permease
VSHRTKVWVALWTVYILWGSTYLGIAIAGETLPPLLAASTRFICAGAIMATVVVCRGGSMRVPWRAFGSCALIGCLLPGANAVLFFAERDVPSGLASLLIASVPLFVVVARLARGERLPTTVLVGVSVGFAGVAILARPTGAGATAGVLLCILSAVMWSLGSVASHRLPMPADIIAATAWEMIVGGLVLLSPALATAGVPSPSTASLLAWLYLVGFGSVIGYTAYTWLLANAPLATVSTYAYVNPVVALGLGVLFRNERLSARILLGAAIVVGAVAVVVGREPEAATHPEEGVR